MKDQGLLTKNPHPLSEYSQSHGVTFNALAIELYFRQESNPDVHSDVYPLTYYSNIY